MVAFITEAVLEFECSGAFVAAHHRTSEPMIEYGRSRAATAAAAGTQVMPAATAWASRTALRSGDRGHTAQQRRTKRAGTVQRRNGHNT